MAEDELDDLPSLHDYHILRCDHHGSLLRLSLRTSRYSMDQRDFVPYSLVWLDFLDVTDIDARPTEEDITRSNPEHIIDRIASRIFRGRDLAKVESARDLMAATTEQGVGYNEDNVPIGTPIDGLDGLPSGYVVKTTLAGSYYIRTREAILRKQID